MSHSVARVQAARRILPPQAISALNLGNEPDSYMWVCWGGKLRTSGPQTGLVWLLWGSRASRAC